jgi:hypothetical protein
MCMACEMDELWMLYLEQQAAKTAASAGVEGVSASAETPGSGTAGAPRPTLMCDEPTRE